MSSDYEYRYWEEQFLNDMVINFCFSGNHEVAFKQRLLLRNSDLNDKNLADVLKPNFTLKTEGTEYTVFRDCWHKDKGIFSTLKNAGFDYQDIKINPDGKYEKTWEGVRKWLREKVFPEYIKTRPPQTAIEIWQELWTTAKDDNKINFEKYKQGISHLGISYEGWNPEPEAESFPIGSRIIYQINLKYSGYLVAVQRLASGNFYCLAPSKLSSVFPIEHTKLILPKKGGFKLEPPGGCEEVIAVLSREEPNLDWLPEAKDNFFLKLETNHLADLLVYANNNNCEVICGKYMITN